MQPVLVVGEAPFLLSADLSGCVAAGASPARYQLDGAGGTDLEAPGGLSCRSAGLHGANDPLAQVHRVPISHRVAPLCVHRGLVTRIEVGHLLRFLSMLKCSSRSDIELCLATGGMVNMPAIWNGLVERFGSRVPILPNRDRIIAEGAAWIAHDGLRLKLAKPIELVVADGGPSLGAYLPLVDAGINLPVEGESTAVTSTRLYCVDPRDGVAVFQFVKPRNVGSLLSPHDHRTILYSLNLPVDPTASPFLERLECAVQIDQDYIARVSLRSKLRQEAVGAEFHDLDFGLALPTDELPEIATVNRSNTSVTGPGNRTDAFHGAARTNVSLRSNVSMGDDKHHDEKWGLVPGDIVESWQQNYFGRRFNRGSEFQREEKMYYERCVHCQRTRFEINGQGIIEECRISDCGIDGGQGL